MTVATAGLTNRGVAECSNGNACDDGSNGRPNGKPCDDGSKFKQTLRNGFRNNLGLTIATSNPVTVAKQTLSNCNRNN
jgi:hypothetical protein